MDVRIAHDTKWSAVHKEAQTYLKEKVYTIWKKALQYANTSRV